MGAIDQTLTSGHAPGPGNPNQVMGPTPYTCWVYRKSDGKAVLAGSKEERDKFYSEGYVDSPAKTVPATGEADEAAPVKKAARKAARKSARKT